MYRRYIEEVSLQQKIVHMSFSHVHISHHSLFLYYAADIRGRRTTPDIVDVIKEDDSSNVVKEESSRVRVVVSS